MEKSSERLAILEKIAELEKNGEFDVDVENDPPSRALKAGEVDFMQMKLTTKIKTLIANITAKIYFDNLIRRGELRIKGIKGIENFKKISSGGMIITANHFNPYDNYAIYKALEPHMKGRMLYKIIREGNYTAFGGLYGFFFRHCNTLPIPTSFSVFREMSDSVIKLLKGGTKILIYPEQAMWWNYKKPRPLKSGAFQFAVKANVPVLPTFITMEDSEKIGADGFPIQDYTIHFLEPIYPNSDKKLKENINAMSQANFNAWKKVYEEFYGTELSY